MCCVVLFNYDYFHIFGSMECENKLQITTILHRRMLNSSASFSHFTLGCLRLPSCDQVIMHLGHLLSFMCIAYPYHFNMLLSVLSKVVCVTRIFSLMASFLTFNSLEVLAVLQNQFLYLTVFFLEFVFDCFYERILVWCL